MAPSITPQDVLLSRKNVEIVWKPFPYFTVPNFLPAEVYAEIARAFPSREQFQVTMSEGKKSIGQKSAKDIIASNPTYQSFYDALASQEFVDDASRVLRRGFVQARMLGGMRRMVVNGGTSSVTSRPISVNVEFSDLPAGAYMTPHTDKMPKLFNLLFYIPPDGWKPEYGGGTDFYAAKDSKKQRNWNNRHLRFWDVDKIFTPSYEPNMMCGFVKTANSWHGVSKLKQPESLRRRSINFSYIMPVEAQSTIPYRAWASFHRRTEGINFRDVPDLKVNPEAGVPAEDD